MYNCKILEFGTLASVEIAETATLIYSDRNAVYDTNLIPRVVLKPFISYAWGSTDGLWINTESDKKKIAQRISTSKWLVEESLNYHCTDFVTYLSGKRYVVEKTDEAKEILVYSGNALVLKKSVNKRLISNLISHNNCIFARTYEGIVYCFDEDLNEIWCVEKNKEINSDNSYLDVPIPYENLLIINTGEDDTPPGGNFEINAYQYDSGELIWQQIVETSPNSSHLVKDKLYVAVENRFIKIDAQTGIVELNIDLDYKTFDGKKGSVGMVYPVSDGLLCFNHQNHFIELRTSDAETVLQTIKLPETYCYHLSVKPPVIEHESKIYFALGHLVMGLNPMKSAIAILTPDETAPAVYEAQLEQRPPHTIEKIKDNAGKNGFRVRMGGDDINKIIRYAHIVLKELAYKSGTTVFFDFETRDKENAGTLQLEIDTKELPHDKTHAELQELFNVIKIRVEDDLLTNDVKAGDGESIYTVNLTLLK